jgi:hypothetical protein
MIAFICGILSYGILRFRIWLQTCRRNIVNSIFCPENGVCVLLRNVGNPPTSLHGVIPEVIRMRLRCESVLLDQLRGRVLEKFTVGHLIKE